MRILQPTLLTLSILALANTGTAATALPWVNGDFATGNAAWTLASTTTIGDADGDGDAEATLRGIGDGSYQLSRGLSMVPMPARTHLQLDIEQGALEFYSFRVILARLDNSTAYSNNAYYLDPTGTLQPNWFDDQVLAWEGRSLTGRVVLDPVFATGFNIPGWSQMNEGQRQAHLATYTYATLVVYGYANGVTTLDNFVWNLHPY